MKIKCGNCSEFKKPVHHESIHAVRECYGRTQQQDAESKMEQEAEARNERFFEEGTEAQHLRYQMEVEADERNAALHGGHDLGNALARSFTAVKAAVVDEEELAGDRLDAMTGAHGRDMASEKQVAYAIDLLSQHVWPDELSEESVQNMERRQVTKLINNLKDAPFKDAPFPDIPSGRYCLEADDTTLRFFEVDAPTKGKWIGRVFMSQLFGSPGDYRKEPVRGMTQARVLTAIQEVGPDEAMTRYGIESRVCGRCHSPLTNKKSLERGIGPHCLSKMGW